MRRRLVFLLRSSSPRLPFHCLFSCYLSRRSLSSLKDRYDPPFSPLPSSKPHKPQTLPRSKPPLPHSYEENNDIPFHSDLPFHFRYSYSETNPAVKPIGFRESPRFSPFGPGRLDRNWDGVSAKMDMEEELDWGDVLKERREVIGESLTDEEVEELVEKYRHSDCNRQINLGKGGVTHNMIDDIHNHWKRAEAVRIKCLGVATLDMNNVCFHLEDKTGGVIIYRNINILLLYRGRNYVPKQRPSVPLMLWKPRAPVYPRLVKNVANGLTFEETKEMRNKGLNSPALMKLSKLSVTVCFGI